VWDFVKHTGAMVINALRHERGFTLIELLVLATSKSGTLLLRRDQGEMAVFWDSRSRRL
jgi:hypothetical protein